MRPSFASVLFLSGHHSQGREEGLLWPGSGDSPSSTWFSLTLPWWGALNTLLENHESGSLVYSPGLRWHGYRWARFCKVFVWIWWLLFKSLLPYCSSPFLVLWIERADLNTSWRFQVAYIFGFKSEIYEAKGKPRDLSTLLFLESQYPYPVCLLCTIQNFLIFVLCNVQGFQLYLAE